MKNKLSLPTHGGYAGQKSEGDHIWSKITWRVLPIVFIAYVMSFLDRINVGYAKLTMQQDLQFSDAIYGLGAGIFFITYLIFEIPSNLWMERIGARRTFMRIMVFWGLTSAATAFVATPTQFYAVRLLLGAAEAGLFPGIILYLSYWFPSARRGRITSMFLFAIPITGVVGGPISGAIIKNMDGVLGWHGWQWMFLVEGLPTVLLGLLVYYFLANKPDSAVFLDAREREVVRQVMDGDRNRSTQTGGLQHQLKQAMLDKNVWILSFVYFTLTCAAYTLTFWMPTMIRALGVTDVASVGWYSAIPFVCGGLGLILIGASSDHFRERRWHVAISMVIGALLLYATQYLGGAFMPTMIILSVASFFTFSSAMFWSIPPTYLNSTTAATGIALISSVGTFGGFVSPSLIGWLKTSTGSMHMGLLAMTAVSCLGALTVAFALPRNSTRVGTADDVRNQ